MRKLFFLLLLIPFFAQSQVWQQNNLEYGHQFKGLKTTRAFLFPLVQTTAAQGRDTGATYYRLADSSLYIYTGSQWIQVTGGGGGSGTVTSFAFTNSTGITGTVTNATTTPTLSLVINKSLDDVTDVGNFTNNEIRSGSGGFGVYNTTNTTQLASFFNVGNDNAELYMPSISTGKQATYSFNSILFTRDGFSAQTITPFPAPTSAVTFTLPNTAINRYIPTTFKINSTTVAANDTGLVDLGTVGGGGSTSLNNVGTGFDLAQQGTANVKRLQAGFGIKLDSTTTANTVRVSLDTTTQTLTDGATITFDANSGTSAKVTITATRTLAFSNFNNGMFLSLLVIQDGTGGWGLNLPAGTEVINGGAGVVTLTTAAASEDILTFWKIGNKIYCNYGKNYN